MGIGQAKQLVPDLIVVPYEFDRYTIVSEQVGDGMGISGCAAFLIL